MAVTPRRRVRQQIPSGHNTHSSSKPDHSGKVAAAFAITAIIGSSLYMYWNRPDDEDETSKEYNQTNREHDSSGLAESSAKCIHVGLAESATKDPRGSAETSAATSIYNLRPVIGEVAARLLQITQEQSRSSDTDDNNDTEDAEDEQMRQSLAEYMKQGLQNQMILWKREHPGYTRDYFELFLVENYPENVKVDAEGLVVSVDPRVQGMAWQGMFETTSPSHPLTDLGPPPMAC
jgi:hypothetical protein